MKHAETRKKAGEATIDVKYLKQLEPHFPTAETFCLKDFSETRQQLGNPSGNPLSRLSLVSNLDFRLK